MNSQLVKGIHARKEATTWETWIQTETVSESGDQMLICEWASECTEFLMNELERAGYVTMYSHATLTRRLLYWCWGIKRALRTSNVINTIPLPAHCEANCNDPLEEQEFNYIFDMIYWSELEAEWASSFMNTPFRAHFFGLLGEFCWRHIDAEHSPAIVKLRAVLDAEAETGSGDEGRGDQTKYFKGNKEYY